LERLEDALSIMGRNRIKRFAGTSPDLDPINHTDGALG
jgi:hypothetical protein